MPGARFPRGSRSHSFVGIPSPGLYPVILPPAASTRWHGTMIGMGLAAMAPPTARPAPPWPVASPIAPYEVTSPQSSSRSFAQTARWKTVPVRVIGSVKCLRLPAKYPASWRAAFLSTGSGVSSAPSRGSAPSCSMVSEVIEMPSLVSSMRPRGESMRSRCSGMGAVAPTEVEVMPRTVAGGRRTTCGRPSIGGERMTGQRLGRRGAGIPRRRS